MKLASSTGIVLFVVVTACGSESGGGDDPTLGQRQGDAIPRQCVDRAGAATDCSLSIAASTCPGDDSSDCFTPTLEQVSEAADGACLRLTYRNACAHVVYSQTCIEYTEDGETTWQCWTSTTFAGADLDLAQCGATGRYAHAQSKSSGQLDVLEAQCPHP